MTCASYKTALPPSIHPSSTISDHDVSANFIPFVPQSSKEQMRSVDTSVKIIC